MSVEDTIAKKLTEAFDPENLEVLNDSDRHAGHAGSPGTGTTRQNAVEHGVNTAPTRCEHDANAVERGRAR